MLSRVLDILSSKHIMTSMYHSVSSCGLSLFYRGLNELSFGRSILFHVLETLSHGMAIHFFNGLRNLMVSIYNFVAVIYSVLVLIGYPMALTYCLVLSRDHYILFLASVYCGLKILSRELNVYDFAYWIHSLALVCYFAAWIYYLFILICIFISFRDLSILCHGVSLSSRGLNVLPRALDILSRALNIWI